MHQLHRRGKVVHNMEMLLWSCVEVLLFAFSCQDTCYQPMVMVLQNLSRESTILKVMFTALEW